jgi:hypothetical protein
MAVADSELVQTFWQGETDGFVCHLVQVEHNTLYLASMSVTTQEGSRSSQASAAMLAAFQADLFCHHAAYANPEEAFDPDANLHNLSSMGCHNRARSCGLSLRFRRRRHDAQNGGVGQEGERDLLENRHLARQRAISP